MGSYHIPKETEIIPYVTKEKRAGTPWLSSIDVDFDEKEILERLNYENHDNKKVNQYLRLSLGENPSPYDSYLVETSKVNQSK